MMLPAPRFSVTAWLLKPIRNTGPEEDAELRQSLQRRLGSIVISAVMTLCISVLMSLQHRQPALLCWTALDAALAVVRIPTVIYIMRSVKRAGEGRRLRPWLVDLFVVLGTLWSSLLGIGALICVRTNDPGLSILAGLLATGTIGAQGVRSPGSPRLNILQMCLVIVPYGVGLFFTTIPMTGWGTILVLFYLVTMTSITLQLHDDYVKLITARIENRKRALHCPLTGLPNRALFGEALTGALETVEAESGAFTVMYLDLDGFKTVNDGLGHGAGDNLLKQVADRLQIWKHPEALAARLGGDEFAVLLRGDADDIDASARGLIAALSRPYDLGADGVAEIGVSIGLAVSETRAEVGSVLMRADQALYAAKRAGKGTFRRYGVAAIKDDPPSTADLAGIARRRQPVRGDTLLAAAT